jgi:hypothetical protein
MVYYLKRETGHIFSKIQKNEKKMNILLLEFQQRCELTNLSNNKLAALGTILIPSEYERSMVQLMNSFFKDYMDLKTFVDKAEYLKVLPHLKSMQSEILKTVK